MAVTTESLRNYLRLPPDSDEDLNGFILAAKSKARTAGIKDFQHNAQYDMFIHALAAMYYEHRGMTFSGAYQATAEANARNLINAFSLELRHATEDGD